jgi:hypothetical protein
MGKTAVSIEDDVLQAGRLAAAARGLSFSAWLTEAARTKARKENAEAYGRWLATQSEAEKAESNALDRLDAETRDASLDGAAW